MSRFEEIQFPRTLLCDSEGMAFMVHLLHKAYGARELYMSMSDYLAAGLIGDSTLFPILSDHPGFKDESDAYGYVKFRVVPDRYIARYRAIWRS